MYKTSTTNTISPITLSVHPYLQHVCRDTVRRAGSSATADTHAFRVLNVAYKKIFGILETDVNAFFTVSSTNNFTRGHNFKLLMPQSRIDVRKYFFACRIVRCWNSLNAEPEHFSSLIAFKKFLQQTDLSKFMLFSH